ncbi:MAG: NAD-dependent epimerase/dehydratase family protein, partial [Proteobacteria bacterium]
MRVLVAGGTGLVGAELLAQLAAEPSGSVEVVHLARRAVEATPPVSVRVVDFAALDAVEVGAAEVGFCALGTTIAKAGSQAAFVQVDRDAVLAYAKLCQRAGAHTFVLVSSLGADPKSRVFYNRIKGDVEAELAKLGFQHLVIVRPSVLDSTRITTMAT